MKNLLAIVSVVFLSMTSAIAGGGGSASNFCFYSKVEVLKECNSELFEISVVTVRNWNFAESGRLCPNGGQLKNIVTVTLKGSALNINNISNPSATIEEHAPIESANRGGGLILNLLQEDGNNFKVSGTINVAWDAYKLVNGKTFKDTVVCK